MIIIERRPIPNALATPLAHESEILDNISRFLRHLSSASDTSGFKNEEWRIIALGVIGVFSMPLSWTLESPREKSGRAFNEHINGVYSHRCVPHAFDPLNSRTDSKHRHKSIFSSR